MIISYAQNFEDVMLWRLFSERGSGFYVDIGAQHSTYDSVSKLFYDRGWRGINVEPIPAYAHELRVNRVNDITIEAAIGDFDGEVTLYVKKEGLSSCKKGVDNQESIVVKQLTVNSLLSEFKGIEIHWLKIDVEGYEEEVIKGWDLREIRPWVVVIEATKPNSREIDDFKWASVLPSFGYKKVYFDGLNNFYLAEEHLHLSHHFNTPPNVFDAFKFSKYSNFVQNNEDKLASDIKKLATELRRNELIKNISMALSNKKSIQFVESMYTEKENYAIDSNCKIVSVDLYPFIAGISGGIIPWVEGVLRELVGKYENINLVMFGRSETSPININHKNVIYINLEDDINLYYSKLTDVFGEIGSHILIRTYPLEFHPNIPAAKQIFVIPDMQHEFYPQFFDENTLRSRRKAFGYALSSAGAIATMTNHSKSTIINNEWAMCDDIFLMPAALPQELEIDPTHINIDRYISGFDEYFYMPANLWSHKNHNKLIKAFEIAANQMPKKTGLILSGNPDGFNELVKGRENLPIKHVGYVKREEVAALIKNAKALVYFSLFEGFGMPLLEAFYHKTPVLCSNTTSLPEVGGDAVLTCDPENIDEMSKLMVMIDNKDTANELVKRGSIQFNKYSWDISASSLYEAIVRLENKEIICKRPNLISIIMPTYNHAKFIKESIDSVLTQSFLNYELIVIDGGSNDGTVEILKSYGNRLTFISEKDNGQANAINKGMKIANGDILCYLNSDDLFTKDALSKVVSFFEANQHCDLVYGKGEYIDIHGAFLGMYKSADYSFERLTEDCCICQPAAFWRRRIANRVGEFNELLQTAMDYEYWLRIANAGGIIIHADETYAKSRLHEDAKTLKMREIIFKEIFQICSKECGYVSESYFRGYFHHKIYEKNRFGKYIYFVFPSFHVLLAKYIYLRQFKGIGNNLKLKSRILRILFRWLERHMPQIASYLKQIRSRNSILKKIFI